MIDVEGMLRSAARPLLGGLDTKTPPTLLSQDKSPDLLNVVLSRRAVEPRSGFCADRSRQPNLNSIRNQGYHTRSRLARTAGSADGDFLIVPGCMYAGHRDIYLGQSWTLELFFEVADLTEEHGGNAEDTAAQFGPAPYTLKVRPVLFKGPAKRTARPTLNGPFSGITWDTAAATQWGGGPLATTLGLPWGIYLFNDAGTWQWRLSFHAADGGGVWQLKTVVSSIGVEVGARYHVIAQIDAATSVGTLRIARLRGKETPSYATDTISFTGQTYTIGNLGPIQVFDCPQQFIEASAVGTTSLRPGLGLGAAADGGYWFAAKRAEGRIEDIAIYRGAQITEVPSALDRTTKLGPLSSAIIGYWSMAERGEGYVKEVSGRGNHLYLIPAGPVYDADSGGPRGKGSWFFNGQTSYALPNLENAFNFDRSNPSWRYLKTGPVPGWMTDAVRGNRGHGLLAEMWVDAIEPNFEQVVAEIHSVLRLAIDKDGTIVGYCRDGTGAPGTSLQSQGATYQAPVRSTFAVIPGKRYTVALFRRPGGTTLDLYVNGQLDSSQAVTAADSAANDGRPPSGVTIGMGSFRLTIRNDAADYANSGPGSNLPDINHLNTDPRSGFCGRIEAVSILGSDATLQPAYKDQDERDWHTDQSGLWESPETTSGNRALIRPVGQQLSPTSPSTPDDTVANVGNGIALEIVGHVKDTHEVRYLVTDTTNPTLYTLSQSVLSGLDAGALAHADLEAVRVRTWHVVFRWELDVDDGESGYAGSYHWGLEYGYDATATTTDPAVRDYFRSVHVQHSAVMAVRPGMGAEIERRCLESDLMDPDLLASANPWVLSHRNRPYRLRSPRELAPRWAAGIVTPLAGTNPLSLIADWQDEVAGERFLVVGCGRQIYWSRPSWRRSSPYATERLTKSLWLGGQKGDHVKVSVPGDAPILLQGTGPTNVVEIQVGLYPMRLDGTRMVCARVTPATDDRTNFLVYFQDGQLRIEGTLDGNTRAWAFYEGDYSSGSFIRPHSTLRAHTWNHLQIVFKTSQVEARINGSFVPLVSLTAVAGAFADAISSGAADAPSGELYLGGLPPDRHRLTLSASTGDRDLDLGPWHGLMADYRMRDAEHPDFPAGNAGTAPKQRLDIDAQTHLLLPLSEGAGFHVFETAKVLSTTADGQIEAVELLTLIEDLEESTDARYDHVVFRDRLMVSNGRSFPHAIAFTRYSDPAGPFRTTRIGMAAPVLVDSPVSFGGGAGAGPITNGIYLVQMTFVDAEDRESEPVQVGKVTITGGPYLTGTLLLRNVPRSPDPQVVSRRFYVSANGGGLPIFFKDVPDNETVEVDFELSIERTGLGTESGVRLPAPKARHIATAQGSLILADLTEIEAGQNAFAVSRADEPRYFTIPGSAILIDSEDSKPITGIQGHLGRLNLSKRDSIWQFGYETLDLVPLIRASLQVVNTSAGFGGGRAVQDNLIYGAGDRGIYAYNGSGVRYDGDPLEGDWQTEVDKSDPGLVAMLGAFYRPASQYWISVRLRGDRFSTRAYVLHVSAGPALAWSRLLLPEHGYLSEVLDPDDQTVLLMLGSTSGALLAYRDSVFGDYHDGSPISNGVLQLVGSDGAGGETLSGTATSLVLSGAAGAFDNAGSILRGAEVEITYLTGVGLQTASRRIESASRTTLRWIEPLPGFVSYVGGSYVLGGYESFWTTGWFANQYGSDQKAELIDLDFLPVTGSCDLVIRAARGSDPVVRAWADGDATLDQAVAVSMAAGYLAQPVKVQGSAHHRWLRLRIGTKGRNKPFGLVGWAARTRHLAARGTPGVTT